MSTPIPDTASAAQRALLAAAMAETDPLARKALFDRIKRGEGALPATIIAQPDMSNIPDPTT